MASNGINFISNFMKIRTQIACNHAGKHDEAVLCTSCITTFKGACRSFYTGAGSFTEIKRTLQSTRHKNVAYTRRLPDP
jgi:hypothetical protein